MVNRYLLAVLPLLALTGLLYLLPYLPLPQASSAVPLESITFEKVTLKPDTVIVEVVNGGPMDVKLAQVLVNDALWGGYVEPSDVIPRLSRATLYITYPWVEGEPLNIVLISSKSIKFEHDIEVAVASPTFGTSQLLSFSLIGVYVGVIPVFLGLVWLPVFRKLSASWFKFLLSFTTGLLIFLGIDALIEATDVASTVAPAFQGHALIIFGVVASFLGLMLFSGRGISSGGGRAVGLVTLAYMISLGVGLHNLGEGLAIGSAYSLGKVALGTFLLIGFTIHNTTEGIAIVAPISQKGTTVGHLVAMGAIAGVPTIAGAVIGGFAYTSFWATLFLALGAGAIFQVVYEVTAFASDERGLRSFASPANIVGLILGILVMYLTGLAVPA